MPRRSKYTPDTIKKLHDALDMGVSYKHAAEYAGITYETFRVWMNEKPAFSVAIKARASRGAVTMMGLTMRAAKEDWHAATWILEHRWPKEYAKNRIEVEHSGTLDIRQVVRGVQAAIDATVSDADTRRRLAEQLMALEPADDTEGNGE